MSNGAKSIKSILSTFSEKRMERILSKSDHLGAKKRAGNDSVDSVRESSNTGNSATPDDTFAEGNTVGTGKGQ